IQVCPAGSLVSACQPGFRTSGGDDSIGGWHYCWQRLASGNGDGKCHQRNRVAGMGNESQLWFEERCNQCGEFTCVGECEYNWIEGPADLPLSGGGEQCVGSGMGSGQTVHYRWAIESMGQRRFWRDERAGGPDESGRSEEHTPELQSPM